MDYDRLTDEEAQDILKNHDEVSEDDYAELEQYIEDPVSVLYWTDADGDFEQAVRIQGLPQDIPMRVARALAEAPYDHLAHEVVTPEVEERTCAGCGQTLYDFETSIAGQNWTDNFWISEWGDHMYDEMEFLSDPAAPPYWQADPDGPMIGCTVCSHDGLVGSEYRQSLREDTGEYALRGFDGETDRLTQYKVGGDCGTVVRDDWYWFSMDDREDKWHPLGEVFPFDEREFMLEYATGKVRDVLDDHDYVIVDVQDMVDFANQDTMPDTVSLHTNEYGTGKDGRRLKEVLTDWSNADEPHPDLPFRYLINKGGEIFVHEDNADELRLELLEQTLRRLKRTAGRKDAAHLLERHRFVAAVEDDEYAELELSTGDVLITDWEGNGGFFPYVEKMGDHYAPKLDSTDPDVIGDEIAGAIEDELGVRVDHMEWDDNNEIYVPYMQRPEPRPVTGTR